MDYNPLKGIDLHIHSAASDGSLSPEEILNQAEILSLGAISITDHDTIDGSREALALGPPPSVKFITGIEISAEAPAKYSISGSLHILGYGLDIENSRLDNALKVLQESRTNRIPKIVDKLTAMKIDISMEDVSAIVGDAIAGRPHVASALIQKGYASDINDAFDRFLGKNRPAYVDKHRIDVQEVISIIIHAGGVPVLAHPFLIGKPADVVESLILDLKQMGLLGIEVIYPEHSGEEVSFLTRIAEKNDLLMTGGTDFHGDIKPEIRMGSGMGNLHVPFELYRKLVNRGR